MVSPGAFVTPQTQLGTLSQNAKYKLDFSVPEQFAATLKKGMMVYVISDVSKDSIPARIIAMESSVNSSSGNLKIRAIPDRGQFIPGAYVKVCIPQPVGQNTIRVPTQAIIPEATAKKLIVVKNGKGQFVKVKTGVRTSSEVEITEGIQPGDTIVVNGILFVKPGAELKISKIISQSF
jgi:membrane fusion protein (multidrug efflux system)